MKRIDLLELGSEVALVLLVLAGGVMTGALLVALAMLCVVVGHLVWGIP